MAAGQRTIVVGEVKTLIMVEMEAARELRALLMTLAQAQVYCIGEQVDDFL